MTLRLPLSVSGGALVYKITAPARQLMAAPLTLGFDQADLTARLAMDGSKPPLSIALSVTGIEAGVGGGPISSLLGGAGGSVHADVGFGLDTTKGLTFGGGARVVLPARPKAGPLDLREIVLELPEGRANTIDVASTITAELTSSVRHSPAYLPMMNAAAAYGRSARETQGRASPMRRDRPAFLAPSSRRCRQHRGHARS